MLNIVMLGRNRPEYRDQCVNAILTNTKSPYRFTFVDDCSKRENIDFLLNNRDKFHQLILNGSNIGAVPSMNSGIKLACDVINIHYGESESEIIVFMEDDCLVTPDWDIVANEIFNRYEVEKRLAFLSGFFDARHDRDDSFTYKNFTCHITKVIPAVFMWARRSTWKTIGLIPPNMPDGLPRGFPSKNRGSDTDWWYMKQSPTSLNATNKRCIVVENLAQHIGAVSSWRVE